MSKDNIMRNSEYLRALGNAVNTEIGFSEANGKSLNSVSKFEHGMNALNQARNRVIPSPSQTINTTASGEGLKSVSKFEQMMKAMSPAGMYWDSGELVWVRPNNTNGSQFVAVGTFFTKIANSTTTHLHNSVTVAENMVKVGTSVVVGNVSNAISFASSLAGNAYTVTSGKIHGAYSSAVSFGSDTWKRASDNTVAAYSHAVNTATHATNSVNKAAKDAASVSGSTYSDIVNIGKISFKTTASIASSTYYSTVSSSSAGWKYVSNSASAAYGNISAHVQSASDKVRTSAIAIAAKAAAISSAASLGTASHYTQANAWIGSAAKSTQSKAAGAYANVAGEAAKAVEYASSQINYARTTSAKSAKSAANAVASIHGNVAQFVSRDVKRMREELLESHTRTSEARRRTRIASSIVRGKIQGYVDMEGKSIHFVHPSFGSISGTIISTEDGRTAISLSESQSTAATGRQPSTIASAYDAAKAAVSAAPGFFSKVQASVAASVTKTIKGVSSTLEEVAKANMMPFPPDSSTAEKQPQLKAVPPKVSESDKIKQEIRTLRSSTPEKSPNGRFGTRTERHQAEKMGAELEVLEARLARMDALSSAARRSAESAVRKQPQRLRA